MYQAARRERTLSRQELDDQGDVVMSEVPIPIFQVVSAPRMMSTYREFLVKWKRARIQYERLVRRNDGVNAVSIRDYVDPNVLEALVDWVLNVYSEEDVTEEMLMTFMNKQCEDVIVDGNAGAIPQVFANLEMDLDVPDTYSRCLKMFQEFKQRSKRAGLLGYFEKNPNEQCKLLVNAVRPMDLQFRIRQMVKFEVDDMRSDPKMLFKQLTKKAAQFNESYLARKFLKTATGDLKPTGCDAEKAKRPTAATNKPKWKPKQGCWNCGQDHWLSECPSLSEAEKKELAAKKRAEFSAKKLRRQSDADAKKWMVSFEMNCGKLSLFLLVQITEQMIPFFPRVWSEG